MLRSIDVDCMSFMVFTSTTLLIPSRSKQSDWRPVVGRELEGASSTPKDLGTGVVIGDRRSFGDVGGTWRPERRPQGLP